MVFGQNLKILTLSNNDPQPPPNPLQVLSAPKAGELLGSEGGGIYVRRLAVSRGKRYIYLAGLQAKLDCTNSCRVLENIPLVVGSWSSNIPLGGLEFQRSLCFFSFKVESEMCCAYYYDSCCSSWFQERFIFFAVWQNSSDCSVAEH